MSRPRVGMQCECPLSSGEMWPWWQLDSILIQKTSKAFLWVLLRGSIISSPFSWLSHWEFQVFFCDSGKQQFIDQVYALARGCVFGIPGFRSWSVSSHWTLSSNLSQDHCLVYQCHRWTKWTTGPCGVTSALLLRQEDCHELRVSLGS